jgi:hypothetical protein
MLEELSQQHLDPFRARLPAIRKWLHRNRIPLASHRRGGVTESYTVPVERDFMPLRESSSRASGGEVFGDEVMAAAMIDRLLHHCHIADLAISAAVIPSCRYMRKPLH